VVSKFHPEPSGPNSIKAAGTQINASTNQRINPQGSQQAGAFPPEAGKRAGKYTPTTLPTTYALLHDCLLLPLLPTLF